MPHEMFADACLKLSTNKWWDGYKDHQHKIIDDSQTILPNISQEKSRGTAPAKFSKVVITSNYNIDSL
ncbi:hypothetical protein HZS_2534 [Henneguya salminicola]|nr:hypothetical protein HZS_2534 [Henneguya salminicola]